jgi:hypothetical protein
MSFYEKYGKPQVFKTSKSLTPKEVLLAAVAKQHRILAGEAVLSAQKKTPIRSWFRYGYFKPTVGVYALFGEASYECKPGEESAMLTEFELSVRKGVFDDLLRDIGSKRGTRGIR